MKKQFKFSKQQYPTIALLTVVVGIAGFRALQMVKNLDLYYNSESASQKAIAQLNIIRAKYGRSSIVFDERAFKLATARAEDMVHNNYYDHTSPSGDCPDKMKASYGFSSNEYLAENILDWGDTSVIGNALTHAITDSIEPWMESRGHRYNLLYSNHTAGAFACYGDKCVFLGLNSDRFGEGCHTADAGRQHWEVVPLQPDEVQY
jgi:uncharacterized protein YkwD